MNQEKAFEFLKDHQPLPDDEYLTEEVIEKYDEARKWYLTHPSDECIPLFLNSFGKGNGLGLYQLIGDVIKKFDHDEVLPYLVEALNSQSSSICYWNSQIAALFPSQELIEPLSNLLKNEDFDIRYASITAFEQIGGEEVREIMIQALEEEQDEEIIELLKDVLSEL